MKFEFYCFLHPAIIPKSKKKLRSIKPKDVVREKGGRMIRTITSPPENEDVTE